MRITVIGATGMVGSRIAEESVLRGHRVTAASRQAQVSRYPETSETTAVAVDATDRSVVRELFASSDAVVLSVRAVPGEPEVLQEVTATVLAAAPAGTRVLVIGGAGPLRCPNDANALVVDDSEYVPPKWRAVAMASIVQLRTCEGYPATDWTYVSPPAVLEPGVRTGHYRRGTDTLLTAPDGSSRISAEDLAVAVLDELENRTAGRRLTVVQR